MSYSRRDFITTAALGSLALGLEAQEQKGAPAEQPQAPGETRMGKPPILISSANGINGMDLGYGLLQRGHDTLDAVIAVGKVQEDNPNDDSVGLGGLPNEDGVVELDSCCMHGPTRRAGAVGCVRWTKNPALLAKAVMEHTSHVMLVGEGADRFAQAVGFPKDELLTERSRKIWMLWKETHSNRDWWGPGLADPNYKVPAPPPDSGELWQERLRKMEEMAAGLGIEPGFRMAAIERVLHPPHGTCHCSALNEKGEMSGMTTTSGLAWKLAGRVGDSPIIGAGSYTDQDVGSAGATGSGEENIRVVGAHTVVENMRKGMSPLEAGLDVLRRIARNFNNDMNKLRYVSMAYYILRKDGAYAGVSLWSGRAERPYRFAVHDGTKRLEPCAALFQGAPLPFPPAPREPYQRPEPVVK
jgi:N4-(beta-N-acetylglucosaminyl)-L-asparaginase